MPKLPDTPTSPNSAHQQEGSLRVDASVNPEDKARYELRQRKLQDYEKLKHYASVTMIVLAPTLALMPPRKFDLYTIALSCGFVASASQLSKERYGRGLIDMAGLKYAERKDRIAYEQAQQTNSKQESNTWRSDLFRPADDAKKIQRNIEQSQDPEKPKRRSLLERIWMGNEGENWRDERAREHADALDRGESIGDIIRGQVSEVWNWGAKSAEQLKEKDEEIVAEKKIQHGSGRKDPP